MKSFAVIGILCVVSMATCGCVSHNVKFVANSSIKVPPTVQATAIDGNIEEAVRLMEQSRLPHNSTRQRFDLENKSGRALRAQLGSDDYVLLGEVYGGGNNQSSLQSLKAALCQKAAAAGGDIVLIFRTGIEDRPFVYSTPGYSSTNMQYSANNYGNYIQGNATAYTTYTPGQTYAGVMHFPYANGLVFKYAPGTEERRRRIAALSDAELGRVTSELQRLMKNSDLTWDQYVQHADAIISVLP